MPEQPDNTGHSKASDAVAGDTTGSGVAGVGAAGADAAGWDAAGADAGRGRDGGPGGDAGHDAEPDAPRNSNGSRGPQAASADARQAQRPDAPQSAPPDAPHAQRPDAPQSARPDALQAAPSDPAPAAPPYVPQAAALRAQGASTSERGPTSAGGSAPSPAASSSASTDDAARTASGGQPAPPGSGLAEVLIRTARNGPAPVHLWDPPYCGEMDLVIRTDGTWVHNGSPIAREAMVRLFASVLKREGGRYYLVTPVEKLGIRVEDAPFVVVDAEIAADRISLTTNLGERVAVGPDHPIRVAQQPDGAPRPYVHIRRGLEALIDRKTFYRLVDAAQMDDGGVLQIAAGGATFALGGVAFG